MGKQELCDSFYDINNLVTIRIVMPGDQWTELRNAEPHGGHCNHAYTGRRYDWYRTTRVDISGTNFPAGGSHRFLEVGISKKSYCGSQSSTKPGLKLDFSRYRDSNEDEIEDLIGTQFITLNNSIQDASYIRQPLGYTLFKQAGLPYSRCNFANVYVNGRYIGFYVNVEPVKKRHIKHNFDDNDEGNLYEIEVDEDFDLATIDSDRLSFEGFSDYSDKKDFELAVHEINRNGRAGAGMVVDIYQFIRFFAMEFLLKHWDGYTDNRNNTYIYNDARAVATPTTANVRFKFIPWGLDQILQSSIKFQVDDDSVLGRIVRESSSTLTRLKTEIRRYANTIFDRNNVNTVLMPYINQMEAIITGAGITDASPHIQHVRQQLRLVKSGAFQFLGELPTTEFFLLDKDTDECMYSSIVNRVGSYMEVYHHHPTSSTANRWRAAYSSYSRTGREKFINVRYNTYLHADTIHRTWVNNYNVMAVYGGTHQGTNWNLVPVDCVAADWSYTGYFRLKNERTDMYVKFSETDRAPGGHKEVHQILPESYGTVLYIW